MKRSIERFVSGINEYVFYTLRSNPTLDKDTILFFVENYLFLDRHFDPQLSWLYNLSRYLNPTCNIHICNLKDISMFTTMRLESKEEEMFDLLTIDRLKNNQYIEMYMRLDQLLLDLEGQQKTFEEILNYIQDKDPMAFQYINVLPKT